jgi:hypothetical protein
MKQKGTDDLWFAAYVIRRDTPIAGYAVDQRGIVKCFFDVDDVRWMELKVEFTNSEIQKYQTLLGHLRGLAK